MSLLPQWQSPPVWGVFAARLHGTIGNVTPQEAEEAFHANLNPAENAA